MMNAASEFDPGPLTWIRGEIELALDRAAQALGQYEQSGDATHLRFCRTHVHQVHGALAMVGLDGLAQLVDSLEGLLGDLEEGRQQILAACSVSISQAIAAIRKYLDDLLAGEPDQPLRLFPVYSALVTARGLAAPSPADLFFPDPSHRPPARPVPVAPLTAEQLNTLLKAERGRFQKGLLAWLRHAGDPREALEHLHLAVENIEATQELPAERAFWWVALAFIESLHERSGEPDPEVRQLLAKIDTQIRRLLEGSPNVAERLLRDVLYAVAKAPANASPLVAEVQSVYRLRELIPASPHEQPASLPQEAALRRLRDTLAATEDVWGKFWTGSPSALQAFEQQARACAELTGEIGHTDLKRLGQSFAALAAWLVEDPTRYNDAVAMEVATAILLLQNAQENFRRLGMDFARQVDLMVARLHACIAGKPLVANDELPLLDEMTRRAQERLLIAQVAREIQSNLGQVEQALDAFFRNPEKARDLAALDAPLKQIGGALAMLGHLSAVAMLKDCGVRIQRFSQPGYAPLAEDFEAVAQQLSLLGFFVDALPHGETDFDAFAGRLRRAEVPAIQAEAVVPAPFAPPVHAAIAPEFVPEPAAAAPTVPLSEPEPAAAGHGEIDAELLEIFLEEAHEVLASIGGQLEQLAMNPRDVEALTTIRRAAHTLKGSGRMVGLVDMGEVAWAFEQTLNMWLRQDMAVTPELLAFIGDAQALFARWVAVLASHGTDVPDPSELVARAEALRGEEGAALPAAVAVHSVELPLAEAGEAPSMVLDLTPAQVPEGAPVAGEFAGSEMFAGLPVAGLGEAAEPASEMADMFADLAGPAGQLAEQPAEMPIEAPLEITAPPPDVPLAPAAAAAPTLYDIFREEARGHLERLVAGYAEIDNNPLLPTSFEMTRAAHTLGGIAATVGLMPLHHLARSLEQALLRRDSCGHPDSIGGLETVRQAIMTVEQMFAGLARQEAPADQAQLIDALGEVFVAPPAAEPEPAEALAVELPEVPAAPAAGLAAPLAPEPGATLRDELDAEMLPMFLEESQDNLRELNVQLRLWRENPPSEAQPHAVARLLHTFKGNARMAGAMNLGQFTHLLESRIGEALAAGEATPTLIDEVEAGCDTLAQVCERLRTTGSADLAPATPVVEAVAPAGQLAAPVLAAEHEAEAGAQRASLRVRADLIDRLVNEAGELSIARARIEGEMRSLKGSLLDLTENVIRLRRQLREIEIQAEGQIQARVALAKDGQADFDPLELDRFTRFQELTRFMAESVNDVATVQQNLLRNLDAANAAILAQARLNRGLQQELMSVRMMPFASQAERLFRIVRQASKELGKRANLDIVGGQVELDRSVLDKMMAPLEHMLRNSVAHGIESRAERLAAGKPEVGEITLALAHEGNEIILALSDDGRGLDRERIRARAEAMGELQPGAPIADGQLFDFIFRPGFSTAGQVSQIAGRGVGMDVVKTEVGELGGRVEIFSQPGRGTTFRLYLPLTLAVTQTLLLRVGTQTFAVPSTMIEQVQELSEEALAKVRQHGEVEWQGNRYPFHFLGRLLGDAGAVPEPRRRSPIVLVHSGAQRVAVQIDEIRGNQEVVVKNAGAQLARVVGIAGVTVLGDGEVVLIVNPVALATRLPPAAVAGSAPAPVVSTVPAVPTVMVVDDSLTVRKITSRLLTREGYEVVLAKDGVDALEQLREVVPDVILSDIEMPRMDGFELLRNIRDDERLRATPVIMITSRTAEKHRNLALELGASDYLGKPYDEEQLLALIARHILVRQPS